MNTSNKVKKTAYRIDIASQALIRVLRGIDDLHHGKCSRKGVVVPMIAKRSETIMEQQYALDMDLEAIPSPNEKFVWNHWSEICKHAANKYQAYVVWPFLSGGVRLGTLEEYQENQYNLKAIANGVVDSISDRTFIIRAHGGKSFELTIKEKKQIEAGEQDQFELLEPGDKEENDLTPDD